MTMFSVLLPVGLMMGKALVDIFIDDENNLLRQTFDILGRPLMALADRGRSSASSPSAAAPR